MDELSGTAEAAYRALVWEDPDFVPFFRRFTPVRELALLEIGSRRLAARAGRGELAALRAIPWVFAWTQNRCLLPAWYGCGTRLRRGATARELRRLYREWPFFRALVENLEMTLAKSSLEIAAAYLALVPDEPALGAIAAEHARTARRARDRRGATSCSTAPVAAALVRLRNPYVDPMNAIQVELLAPLPRSRERGGASRGPRPLLAFDRRDRRGAPQHG
jgi:phosphoenolpyruvate carboxylase